LPYAPPKLFRASAVCRKLTESLPQNGETFIEVSKKMCYDKEQYKKEEEYGT
jgi:hypothetical protein